MLRSEWKLEEFTPAARALLSRPQARADRAHHTHVAPLHVLAELLVSHVSVFREAGADPVELMRRIDLDLIPLPRTAGQTTGATIHQPHLHDLVAMR